MPMTNNNEAQDLGRARCTKYHMVSENTRKAIIKYWEDNHCSTSFNKMVQDTRVQSPTFKSIVKLYRETGRVEKKQRSGRSHNCINDKHLQFIKDCVENPSVTLETIQGTMKNHFNMKRPHSISGIDYALENGIQYTLKQIHKYPERRNNQNARVQRRDHCSMLRARDINYSSNCTFIDESGFNLRLTKGYVRSEGGLPVFRTVSSQRKRYISLMAAMSVNGVQFSATNNTVHGMNGTIFTD